VPSDAAATGRLAESVDSNLHRLAHELRAHAAAQGELQRGGSSRRVDFAAFRVELVNERAASGAVHSNAFAELLAATIELGL